MLRPCNRRFLENALPVIAVVACLAILGGCRTDSYYMDAQAPPASDPAQLKSAMAKLDTVYKDNFGTKYSSALADSQIEIERAVSRGDAGTACNQVRQNRQLMEDASAAAKATVVALGRNTMIVNATDHDAYVDFFMAETDRLNSKVAEYNALLALKPSASKDDTDAITALVADATVKEAAAIRLLDPQNAKP